MLNLERESELVAAASAGWAIPTRERGEGLEPSLTPRVQAELQVELALLALSPRGGEVHDVT